MSNVDEPLAIGDLLYLHRERGGEIRERLAEFARVPKEEYFYECVYCVLTPQSSAVNAGKAVAVLRKHDLFNTTIDTAALLHGDDFYIRFHHTKAHNLQVLKEKFPFLRAQLESGVEGPMVREWIVDNIRGMGWKEASHFLRNIGYRNLAILDRHILKNLIRVGVLQMLPKSLPPKVYLAIEIEFKTFADKVGIPMDELDLLFWSMETGVILK